MASSLATKRPLWLGVALAPWAPPAALFFAGVAGALATDGARGASDWQFAAGLFIAFGLPISYLAMVALGLPYLIWLRRVRRFTWFYICTGGVGIGAVTFPATLHVVTGASSPALAFPGAGLGLLSALAFCAVTGPNNSSMVTPVGAPQLDR
jgi:hypothetical protein